jgi:small subunit ribosomal protein S25e
MGGAKKRSLAQAEKQQQMQTTKQQKDQKAAAKAGKAEAQEKAGRFTDQDLTEKELNELAKIKALTPYAVATKYNIKLSVAKDILETLEKKKAVQQVASGGGFKVYKLTGNA